MWLQQPMQTTLSNPSKRLTLLVTTCPENSIQRTHRVRRHAVGMSCEYNSMADVDWFLLAYTVGSLVIGVFINAYKHVYSKQPHTVVQRYRNSNYEIYESSAWTHRHFLLYLLHTNGSGGRRLGLLRGRPTFKRTHFSVCLYFFYFSHTKLV